jgi:hypothetical protein
MTIWQENCASRFEANNAVNDVASKKKYTEMFSAKKKSHAS